MGRPKIHENSAARQRAYAARKREWEQQCAKSAKREADAQRRIAIGKGEVRNQLREWLTLCGEDGLEAAQRQARKRLHPDAGGNEEDFVRLTLLTEWMKKELNRGPFGFFRMF